MATVVLQAAGAAVGSMFGPVGAMIGQAAGAMAGSLIDQSLISSMTKIDGTHLPSARIAGAEEGTPITRVYGTVRIGGTLIWATRFQEQAKVEREGAKSTGPRVETFSYRANLAIGLCQGSITGIRRVWADGQEIDLTGIEMRLYRGTFSQNPDPLIEAKQGAGKAPAYRGLAYVVFDGLPLDPFGNRIPVFQFEVMRSVGTLEGRIKAVTLIPGATEHGYAPFKVTEKTGEVEARIINRNQLYAPNDFKAAVDEMLDVCPNLERVAIVVSWFGSDLRAGQCKIEPGVERQSRREESTIWSVSGIGRGSARLISKSGGKPAFGGTPDDQGLIAAIKNLKDRGIKVFLYPFLLMDIPPGNSLASPYGGDSQPRFPWRGRITCHPAPGQPGSVDQTASAATQIANFIGNANGNDFTRTNSTVTYQGNDKGYRRLILHYAHLAEAAGGVDGIIIGSELRGLTTVRDQTGQFPFVNALRTLAFDVKAITGPATKLTYGADWSEYFGYHPVDGTGDVYFHLDPLWASPNIDAVGIDNYMPLADWRDEDFASQNPDGAVTADDVVNMRANIISGEGFDWYYASDNARALRQRSPITDGLAGKDWVFRFKDIENWWSNRHFNRVNGVESLNPTAWTAQMKPIWFTELGCPAIDRGANQPNVFVDPASSESFTPYFSAGRRSDCMQRRFLDAHLGYWNGSSAPQAMVDPGHIFVWTFDARPVPAFPEDTSLFADGDNWTTGHWLNGRLGAGTLPIILSAILKDHGVTNHDVSAVSGDLSGYVQGGISSGRQLIEPLLVAFRVDVHEQQGKLIFRSRGAVSAPATPISVFADHGDDAFWSEKRSHESDFVSETILDYVSASNDYEQVSSRSRRLTPGNDRVMRIGLQGVLAEEEATRCAQNLLRDQRLSRRSVTFAISPQAIALEPGDVVEIVDGPQGRFQIDRIEGGEMRSITAHEIGQGDISAKFSRTPRRNKGKTAAQAFSPVIHLMDLPRYKVGNSEDFLVAAITAKPWRSVVLSSSPTTEGYQTRTMVTAPARSGRLTQPLAPGTSAVFDDANKIKIELYWGVLQSSSKIEVFNGANRLGVQSSSGVWEIIGFLDALEDAPGRWTVSRLLRGLAGTADAMDAGASVDAPVVVLDGAVVPIGLTSEEAGLSLNIMANATGQAGGQVGPLSFSGGLRAQTPLAPVHLQAIRQPNGDVTIRFIRAGRLDADGWNNVEIPLDEPEEAYLLEIMDGTHVKRTVDLSTPQWLYTLGQQSADFGSPLVSLTFKIRQKGRKVALGIPASRTLVL